jgi:hypothetical protein
MNNTPNTYDLDYRLTQVTSDVIAMKFQADNIQASMIGAKTIRSSRAGYLRKLLIFRAQQKLLESANDYVNMLCTIYSTNATQAIPHMDVDTTPPWMVADAVLAEDNEKDRLALTDVFRYMYECEPHVFFI